MAFFKRFTQRDRDNTEQAVRKTRQTWFGQMAALFQRSQLDDALWDDMEEDSKEKQGKGFPPAVQDMTWEEFIDALDI